jgi:hypothetical protein
MGKTRFGLAVALLLALADFLDAGQGPLGGEQLYRQKCGRCHIAYAPEKYSSEEWKTVLREMGPLAGLTEETEKEILQYLAEASAAPEKRALPTAPVLAGYLYTEYFSSPDAVDTFDMHYLNLNLAGRVHERVSYRAEFEFEHGGGAKEPPFIEQAYLDVWFGRNAALRVGAMLAPFNRFDELHGPLENYLVTRPSLSREIGVSAWKEVGVDAHGSLALHKSLYLNYDAYIINGLGAGSRLRTSRQYLDNNDAKSLGFRVSGVLADAWEAGASYYRGAWDTPGDLNLWMAGLHFLGRLGDLHLFAEYARSVSENPPPLEEGKATGFFLQASYLLQDKFRPTLRYGTLDYLDPGSLLGRSPTNFDDRALALGFNYYLSPAIVFKVEYDVITEGKRLEAKDNNLLAFQAALRF